MYVSYLESFVVISTISRQFSATSPLPSNHILSGQAITQFDDVETISTLDHSAYGSSQYPTRHYCTYYLKRDPSRRQSQQAHPKEETLRHSNGAMQLLQRHISFLKSAPVHESQVAEVAAGRKFTVMWIFLLLLPSLLIGALQRLAVVKVPEYIKVDDTRYPLRQKLAVSQDMAQGHSSPELSETDSLPDVHWCKAFFCYYSCWSHDAQARTLCHRSGSSPVLLSIFLHRSHSYRSRFLLGDRAMNTQQHNAATQQGEWNWTPMTP
ncbi:hypothetical protein BDR07DRAFT_1382403 [Suillus spraguei]|nr:hypothetical protein BDR07DRAFT_1382403 [Suillus spraguei]